MTELTPLDLLYEAEHGEDLPLPPALARAYGRLQMPAGGPTPRVISNFVSTLDGVVDLNDPRYPAGGPIGGDNRHDRMTMGILRAISDAVIVGAGTLRSAPKHLWTAEHVFPALSNDYQSLRRSLDKQDHPLNVIVTARGNLDLGLRVFRGDEVRSLIVTTEAGARRLGPLPEHLELVAVTDEGDIPASAILDAVGKACPGDTYLLEGGPHLMGDFFAERLVDELFLTLAPQVAGRGDIHRPGLVEGMALAPETPAWAELVSVRRAKEHLFLRYSFRRG